MISEIMPGGQQKEEKPPEIISPEVWIPEFGLFDMVYLEPGRKYQGRLYRLSPEQIKIISENIGFTARFEHANIRAAYVDLIKTEGHIVLELERNTKPLELSLRYSRDRWTTDESTSKGADTIRPWTKSLYDCRFMPEKAGLAVAGQLRLEPAKAGNFYIRVNFKERTAGLIAEDNFIDAFPGQPFAVFALPEGHVPVIPAIEPAGTEELSTARQVEPSAARQSVQEAGPKYATYSRSEIDRMLKMQAENITGSLSSKMSGQQKSFLEAVEAQEKAFARITERYATQFDEARAKLEANTKAMQQSAQANLEKLNADLSRELSEFRLHVNKNILPVSRAIEEKVKEMQIAVARPVDTKSESKLLVIALALAIAVAMAIAYFLYMNTVQLSELPAIKDKLVGVEKVLEKETKFPEHP